MEDEGQMNISQEILVLDFGDEKNDFFRSETDFKGNLFNQNLFYLYK